LLGDQIAAEQMEAQMETITQGNALRACAHFRLAKPVRLHRHEDLLAKGRRVNRCGQRWRSDSLNEPGQFSKIRAHCVATNKWSEQTSQLDADLHSLQSEMKKRTHFGLRMTSQHDMSRSNGSSARNNSLTEIGSFSQQAAVDNIMFRTWKSLLDSLINLFFHSIHPDWHRGRIHADSMESARNLLEWDADHDCF
jgi:hypothetical protein